ncbi:MAG: transposase [Sphingobacteriales bacterium]|nr:transposase [Sphingobacteriales bacterium]
MILHAVVLSPDKRHNDLARRRLVSRQTALQKILYISNVKTSSYPEFWPQFYTATINKWKHLLNNNECKEIIIDSLRFLVKEKRVVIYSFVIMSNHIHIIWQALSGHTPSAIQSSFMKYTSHQILEYLQKTNHELLVSLIVNKGNRNYQVWKREALSIELRSSAVFNQKLDYIHSNPLRAGLCLQNEDYHYSSAKFYNGGEDVFKILTHYLDS